MTRFKRLVTLRTIAVICAAAFWVLFAATAFLLQPGARQSAQAHRLADLYASALKLKHGLQMERVASIAHVASRGESHLVDLSHLRQVVDKYHRLFRKFRARFDDKGYHPSLSAALDSIGPEIAKLKELRKRVSDRAAEPAIVDSRYEWATRHLSTVLEHVSQLRLDDALSRRARYAFIDMLHAGDLSASAMSRETLPVLRGTISPAQKADLQNIFTRLDVILARAASQPPPGGKTNTDAANNARDIRELSGIRSFLLSAKSLDEITPSTWFDAAYKRQQAIQNLTLAYLSDLKSRTYQIASRAATLFTAGFLLAGIVSVGFVAWQRPAFTLQSLLVIVLLLNVSATVWALSAGYDVLSREHGPLESLQIAALAATFALSARHAMLNPQPLRTAAVIFAVLCFVFMFREFDFRSFNVPDWLIAATSGPKRRQLFWGVLAILGVYVIASYRNVPHLARASITRRAWPLFLWLLLLLTGEQIEEWTHDALRNQSHSLRYWSNGEFWEELLELNAYITLLYAAWLLPSIYGTATGKVPHRNPGNVARLRRNLVS